MVCYDLFGVCPWAAMNTFGGVWWAKSPGAIRLQMFSVGRGPSVQDIFIYSPHDGTIWSGMVGEIAGRHAPPNVASSVSGGKGTPVKPHVMYISKITFVPPYAAKMWIDNSAKTST